MVKGKTCRDCRDEGVTSKRKASYPGPRCFTHHKAVVRHRKSVAHERHIGNVFGISAEDYRAMYESQGGKCAICQRATGASKRLAVEHDHATGWIRGLCCSPCNVGVLGHLRDDPEALLRAADYLMNPPAFAVIGKVAVPFDEGEE